MQAWEHSLHPEMPPQFCDRWPSRVLSGALSEQWCSLQHAHHLWLCSEWENVACRCFGLVLVVFHTCCRSGTTMSEGWLPVMAAEPADSPWLASLKPDQKACCASCFLSVIDHLLFPRSAPHRLLTLTECVLSFSSLISVLQHVIIMVAFAWHFLYKNN